MAFVSDSPSVSSTGWSVTTPLIVELKEEYIKEQSEGNVQPKCGAFICEI